MTLEELEELARKERENLGKYKHKIMICGSASCDSLGSGTFKRKIEEVLAKYGLKDEVAVMQVGCMGLCSKGPLMRIEPEGIIYTYTTIPC
jgi:NADH:ubiquinone oxidoreductase subunit E